MTSAGYFEDAIMAEAPPLPAFSALPNTPRAADPTETRNPFSERLLNSCVPAIRRKTRKALGGKENKGVGASSAPTRRPGRLHSPAQSEDPQTSPQLGKGLFGQASETFVLDENGMIVEALGVSDPLEKFQFEENLTEAEKRKEGSGVFCDELGADLSDADVMEYLTTLRRGSGGFGPQEKRAKPSWIKRLGWRFPGAQEPGRTARFRPGREAPVGDEMVFKNEEERKHFFHYYPGGKAFPVRNGMSKRATWQEAPMTECRVAERARMETPRGKTAFSTPDEMYDDLWKMETLLAQGQKLDDLSMLAEEFVSNSPYRSARAATWLKEMDARRGPLELLGECPPGYVACGQCGWKGSPEHMAKCKGGVSCLLGRKASSAEKEACKYKKKKAPENCGRELCKECRPECALCGAAVCGKHSWSTGFGCRRSRFCLTCDPIRTNTSKVPAIIERNVEHFPCPLCYTKF